MHAVDFDYCYLLPTWPKYLARPGTSGIPIIFRWRVNELTTEEIKMMVQLQLHI